MTQPTNAREERIAATFVRLADTLVLGFDVADLFHDLADACVELLQVSATGLMLVDVNARLRVMASSDERSRLLELLEIQNDEGPCLDCHRTGVPVLATDLLVERTRWPRFAEECLRVGFGAVYALPMRLRDDTIGALNLFDRDPNAITATTLSLGQALADLATIAILQQRAARSSDELSQQLQSALNSRIVIEQAKGVLAGRLNIDVATAFTVLRAQARYTRQSLSATAHGVVTGDIDVSSLNVPRTPPGTSQPAV